MPLGVKALNTYPLKSSKRDLGLRDIPITIGGAIFKPGDWVYADKDGILVSPEKLAI
jgi:regulator of ribonuclease activity A